MGSRHKVIEICGEGKGDLGKDSAMEEPKAGVVPILVHAMCGKPPEMRVKRRSVPSLQGKGLAQKVKFAKRQAFYNKSAALVFVMDSEGNHKQRIKELKEGRDSGLPDFPAAVGVAHPCIEAWLLADAAPIYKAHNLSVLPTVPDTPEDLPAPRHDGKNNPKVALANCADGAKGELSSCREGCDRVSDQGHLVVARALSHRFHAVRGRGGPIYQARFR